MNENLIPPLQSSKNCKIKYTKQKKAPFGALNY